MFEFNVMEEIDVVKTFNGVYNMFHDGDFSEDARREHAKAFDDEMKNNNNFREFVSELNQKRMDICSSDNEAAAAHYVYEYLNNKI